MVLYNNYFDTGGTQNDQWVIVTAGLVATAKKWERFEERWQRVLDEFGVTQFHMVDFAHSRKEFASWQGDQPRRDAFIGKLIKEIKRGVNKVFLQGVKLPAYREANRKFFVRELFGGPYSLAQATCLLRACQWLLKTKQPNDRVHNLVERGDAGQGDFRAFCTRFNLHRPSFIEKVEPNTGKVWLPLQAADLVVYEQRRVFESMTSRVVPERGWRQSLRELVRLLPMDENLIGTEYFEALHKREILPARGAPQ